MNEQAANPFSPRVVLGLVLFGSLAFIALLWMIGSGYDDRNTNDGGAHVSGKGLTGYAALAQYLGADNYRIERVRTHKALQQEGLLVLTPPPYIEGAELEKVVQDHRYRGPTLVIMPKWLAMKVPATMSGGKPGWVALAGSTTPEWKGFHDDVSIKIDKAPAPAWQGFGLSGALPDASQVLAGQGENLVPLVTGKDNRVLAAYVGDNGYYPGLERAALTSPPEVSDEDADTEIYPLVLVFEPDLLNNYGFARAETAQLADRLIGATINGGERRVAFDLTLDGYERSQNLLTLAITPPFLAATLCLILAALALGWRAFNRFGPPRFAGRAIAFGKRALVSNAAGLIRRTRRFHLLAAPYADATRERLARALALPHGADPAATEAAIDRAIAARSAQATPFSDAAAAMRSARRPLELLRAAQALHALERMLKR